MSCAAFRVATRVPFKSTRSPPDRPGPAGYHPESPRPNIFLTHDRPEVNEIAINRNTGAIKKWWVGVEFASAVPDSCDVTLCKYRSSEFATDEADDDSLN